MGNGDLKHYESSVHRPVYMVSDLLIQKRGYGRNLLAVEMKRKGNHRNVAEDKERLKALVSSPSYYEEGLKCVHDTLVGVFKESGVQELYTPHAHFRHNIFPQKPLSMCMRSVR